jgi:hypothetical protein
MRVPVDGTLFSIPPLPASKAPTETKASPPKPSSPNAPLPTTSSIPTIKLSPEVSKALIAGGIFDHDPKTTVWVSPAKAATTFGAPVGSVANFNLAGVPQMHPFKVSGEEDVFAPNLRSALEEMAPVLEGPGLEPIAEGVALIVATPEICKALADPSSKTAKEKFFLYGTNIVRVLALTSRAAHLPFDDAMDNIITLFKSGEEVYVVGEKKSAGITQRGVKK